MFSVSIYMCGLQYEVKLNCQHALCLHSEGSPSCLHTTLALMARQLHTVLQTPFSQNSTMPSLELEFPIKRTFVSLHCGSAWKSVQSHLQTHWSIITRGQLLLPPRHITPTPVWRKRTSISKVIFVHWEKLFSLPVHWKSFGKIGLFFSLKISYCSVTTEWKWKEEHSSRMLKARSLWGPKAPRSVQPRICPVQLCFRSPTAP